MSAGVTTFKDSGRRCEGEIAPGVLCSNDAAINSHRCLIHSPRGREVAKMMAEMRVDDLRPLFGGEA